MWRSTFSHCSAFLFILLLDKETITFYYHDPGIYTRRYYSIYSLFDMLDGPPLCAKISALCFVFVALVLADNYMTGWNFPVSMCASCGSFQIPIHHNLQDSIIYILYIKLGSVYKFGIGWVWVVCMADVVNNPGALIYICVVVSCGQVTLFFMLIFNQ